MAYDPRAGVNGAQNKRVKAMVQTLVVEYLEGRKTGDECMRALVQEAKRN